jgi:hypothetical protein
MTLLVCVVCGVSCDARTHAHRIRNLRREQLLVTGAYMSMSTSSADAPMHVHFSPQVRSPSLRPEGSSPYTTVGEWDQLRLAQELHVAVEETRRLGKHVMAHAHSAEGIKQAVRHAPPLTGVTFSL